MKVFLLSGARHLKENLLRKNLKIEEIEHKFFPDNEQYIRIPKINEKERCIIIQSMYNEPDKKIIETVFSAKTITELGGEIILGIFPYLAYTRQDKRYKEGEAISQILTLELINFSGIKKLITYNVHFHQGIPKINNMIIYNLSCVKLFAENFKNLDNTVIIGPDDDAYKLALELAEILNFEAGYIEKRRISEREVVSSYITIDVKNKNVIIIDDMISTGGTVIEAYKLLKKENAKDIYVAAIHGIFAENSLERLRNLGLKRIITTNTIPNPVAEVDISSLLFEEIKKHE